MNRIVHRRTALRVGLAAGASLLLPSARACEFDTATLRVTHPWTRASAPGATFAIVSMKFDQVQQADRLILVESPVASGAEMGGRSDRVERAAARGIDFFIPAGVETHLAEAQTYVRLTGLRFALEIGRSYPLTLGFEKGGVVDADLSVDYA